MRVHLELCGINVEFVPDGESVRAVTNRDQISDDLIGNVELIPPDWGGTKYKKVASAMQIAEVKEAASAAKKQEWTAPDYKW